MAINERHVMFLRFVPIVFDLFSLFDHCGGEKSSFEKFKIWALNMDFLESNPLLMFLYNGGNTLLLFSYDREFHSFNFKCYITEIIFS